MIEIFPARKILTMNPSWPEASAIAVRDGRILELGSLDACKAWGRQDQVQVRRDFADKVLLPGFIDPHLHPMMAAVLLPMEFITALEWRFPWQTVPAVTSPAAYREALSQLSRRTPKTRPFFTWGYHASWHGDMHRALLDELFGERPAVVWQRSFHEVFLNTAMMQQLGMQEEKLRGRHQIDYDRGHFYEVGLGYAINKLNSIVMAPAWIDQGLARLKQLVHFGGQTSLGDMAVGLFDLEMEWAASRRQLEPDAPFRVVCVPHALRLGPPPGDLEAMVAAAEALAGRSTERFWFGRRIKLFTDGAFFAQRAMLLPPGYLDGHTGDWLIAPEEYERIARAFWLAGFRIHVHCTGDLGLELAVSTLEKLQSEKPRFNHGYTIEHFGFSTPEQVQRIRALGAAVSANVYYLHELSDVYAKEGVGEERSYQMARLGSCERAGIPWTLHSDFPMAPALPLHNAWVAATRINCAGHSVGEAEKVSLAAALRAVTIDAARILGIEDETGSLRAGKYADLAVLDADPFEAGVSGLREIRVLATLFQGQVAEVQHP